ncbi:MAG TPA: protein-L-isoaspartate O-methyltransferase [Halothiobacillaceae bacterium]|nr:protein-L-isoaspartate O-methyltransferase [Halothiobacillaceae bacterium]
MTSDIELARFNMVEQQIRPWDVLDKRVLEVFFKVPRERFVPEDQQAYAFSDMAIPLAHHQHMLRPVVEGRILEHLQIQPNEHILEIGTGSGFFTACLATLGKSVRSVDIHKTFTKQAAGILDELGFDQVALETGDAHAGWALQEQFDVIVFTGALAQIPEVCKSQLTEGGRLLAITGKGPIMTAEMITRKRADHFETQSLFETCTDYLKGAEPAPEFTL